MKIQNMAIIFLAIVIPLIAILSYYLDLQQKTLILQSEYDIKLSEATKDGIDAFEINTVDWGNKKGGTRTNASAMVSATITSLANHLFVSGTAKEYMQNYIPAMVVTMYDGYYIYSPNYVPVTKQDVDGLQLFEYSELGQDRTAEEVTETVGGTVKTIKGKILFEEEGNATGTTDINKAKTEYKHELSNKTAYSEKLSNGCVISYTLDNKISVYGSDFGVKEGYLTAFNDKNTLPEVTVVGVGNNRKISTVKRGVNFDSKIKPEVLSEQIVYFEEEQYKTGVFIYVYDTEGTKTYYDQTKNEFFTLKDDKTMHYLDRNAKLGSSSCKYKTISVLANNSDGYIKLYQVLNGAQKGKWYTDIIEDSESIKKSGQKQLDTIINETGDVSIQEILENTLVYYDYRAISYYVEAYAFTNWANTDLGLNISINNNPDDVNSEFNEHKENIMKKHVESSLNMAISSYNENGINGTRSYQFRIPVLESNEWKQLFSNVSILTFFQGIQTGLRTYNNYAIATSTTNKEFVVPKDIYFTSQNDDYFHSAYCEKCINVASYTGYRSAEYVQKKYTDKDGTIKYYYEHAYTPKYACYYCIVNKNNIEKNESDTFTRLYNQAIGRERYFQNEKIIASNAIK